ncbi:uncharacterized protein LOC132560222 [Ylistrum balloti]|uniref:uncharacterized protein LOC132560222 n=1 Tax=Ylistrum balloti TaxID=509963 RepID=UPI002905A444|nr:uncharacterized protein LOC132560222 [Ylistrum balloti]
MDYFRVVSGGCRLMVIVFIVLTLYQPYCQGITPGRASVSSKSRIRKVISSVKPVTKGNASSHKVKRPTETSTIHRTRIVPSKRITSCLKLQCPVATPKSCRYLTIVLLRGGKRCHKCSIKRSKRCHVAKPTKKVIPRKVKTTSKPSRNTAGKSRKPSARIKDAVIRTRTRAKLNNFEGRWMKGFSSD